MQLFFDKCEKISWDSNWDRQGSFAQSSPLRLKRKVHFYNQVNRDLWSNVHKWLHIDLTEDRYSRIDPTVGSICNHLWTFDQISLFTWFWPTISHASWLTEKNINGQAHHNTRCHWVGNCITFSPNLFPKFFSSEEGKILRCIYPW